MTSLGFPSSATSPGVRPLSVSSLPQMSKEALDAIGRGPGRKLSTAPRDTLNKGLAATDRLMERFNPASINTFLNPFTENVVNTTTDSIFRNRDRAIGDVNERAARLGSFGSTAQGNNTALTNEAAIRSAAEAEGALRAQGFNNATNAALQQFGQETTNAGSAASLFGNISDKFRAQDAFEDQNYYDRQLKKLGAGTAIQNQNQRQLDAVMADRAAQLGFPNQQIATAGSALGIFPPGGGSQTSNTSGNALQGALGGGLLGSQIDFSKLFSGGDGYGSGWTPPWQA